MNNDNAACRRRSRAWLAMAFCAATLTSFPAMADAPRQYQIEGGRLDGALSHFASEAGLTLVIDGRLTEGKITRGLDGAFSTRQGLDQLLTGTGLEAVRQPNGSYRLKVADPAAAPNQLEKVTVTSASASGKAVDVANAPASISVIGREELEGKSYRDITEALQDVPGVYVDDGPSSKGGTETISIRGMDSKYTLILVDGRPQGSGQSYYNGFGTGAEYGWLPPISAIERIEVIRGPMSSLYGSDALGGVINVITKGTPDQWGGSLTLERTEQENHDSGDYQQQRFYLSGPLLEDRLGLTVTGTRYQRDEDHLEGGYHALDRDSHSAKLSWTPSEDQTLALEAGYGTQLTEGSADKTGSDSELYTVRRYQALTHDLLWGGKVSTNSYVQHEELENQTQDARYARTTANTQSTLPLGNHVITAGAQYREQQTENPTRAIGEPDLERWDMALFAEDQWFITDPLALTAGLRWVDDEHYGSEAVPRLYAVYNLSSTVTLKGGASAGYRTPDLKQGDSNWVEGGGGRSVDGGDIGNDNLKPEKSVTYEIGAMWESDNGVQAGLTVYQTDYQDKIEKPLICDRISGPDASCVYQGYDYEKLYRYTNVDEARIQGAEATLSFPVGSRLRVDTNYTLTDSEQLTGDDKGLPLNDQPRHRANIALNWRANDATRVWAKARYKGSASQIAARSGLSEKYPGYTLVDSGLVYALTEQLDVYGSVENVFDKDINTDDYGRILDGRRYSAGLTFNF